MAGATTAPGIEPGTGDAIHTTHQRDGIDFPVYFDELEDFRFRSEVNRMAFFRSSCSCCSTLYFFSRSRSRLSSATVSSSSLMPLVTINPSLACLRHRDSMKGWMASASATSWSRTSGRSDKRTAVALKCMLSRCTFGGLDLPIKHLRSVRGRCQLFWGKVTVPIERRVRPFTVIKPASQQEMKYACRQY